jgi:hypothetical protein
VGANAVKGVFLLHGSAALYKSCSCKNTIIGMDVFDSPVVMSRKLFVSHFGRESFNGCFGFLVVNSKVLG